MEAVIFKEKLIKELNDNICVIQSKESKDWVVKGFIDTYRNIYTISIDTKVISKILELMLFPCISNFASKNNIKMEFARHQNHYPDITFECQDGTLYALDIKSTYRVSDERVNGFTLGCFTGYFRNRESNKNITIPYKNYKAHFVLGIIYTKQDSKIDERQVYNINEIDKILSVVSDFEFIIHEKYKIANSHPGSGNTKNIGSIVNTENLRKGNGPFAELGIEIFDDYWMYYLTKDMADNSVVPYSNLKEYVIYKQKGQNIDISKIDGEEETSIEED